MEINVELLRKFVSRTEPFARQLDTGAYFVVDKELTDIQLKAHLDGEKTLGTYVMDIDGNIKWICIDIDCEIKDLPLFDKLADFIYDLFPDFDRVKEFSGRRGYHIWLFLEKPSKPRFYRELVISRLLQNGVNSKTIEIYPKQNALSHTSKGLGNLLKLPFGIHQRSGKRSTLLRNNTKK
jgi:hypothetical protein